MHFGTKSYLKSTRNHTAKHALDDFHNGLATNLAELFFFYFLFFFVQTSSV